MHDNGKKTDQGNEKQIIREMLPYFVHVVWPILIIIIIAKLYGPSY